MNNLAVERASGEFYRSVLCDIFINRLGKVMSSEINNFAANTN